MYVNGIESSRWFECTPKHRYVGEKLADEYKLMTKQELSWDEQRQLAKAACDAADEFDNLVFDVE